jgi:hypothetical protein
VAFHDKTAKRVAGRDWPIAGCTYGQLEGLRVNGCEPIAHLDDILNLLVFHRSKVCYFDLGFESTEDAAELAVRIKKAGLAGRSWILTFADKKELLYAAKCAVPDIGIAVMPFFPYDITGSAKTAGAGAVCAGWVPEWSGTRTLFKLGARMFDFGSQVREAAACSIKVSGGVANDYYDARWLAERGVSGIWTDDVPKVLKALRGG